ncbi:MAG TPA: prolyl oligopeptidase family serine peptidase [Steroidobacteraceae bacterium]|nr:prolyl oligopeptidase family serine peptidase [Steroidobacteraceae bacterium]
MGELSLSKRAAWLLALLACATGMTTVRAVPLEIYGRLPGLEEMALSADASKLAFVKQTNDARFLAVVSLPDGKLIGGAPLGEVKLRRLQWADDRHLMIITSKTDMPLGLVGMRTEWTLLGVYDLDSHKIRTYPQLEQKDNTMNVVAGDIMVRHLGPDTVLYIPGIVVLDRTELALFKVNLTKDKQTLVRTGGDWTRGWLVDAGGEVVAEESYIEHNQQWELRTRRGGRLERSVAIHEGIDIPSLIGFGPGEDAVMISMTDNGHRVWKLVSLADGQLGGVMPDSEKLSVRLEDETNRMIGGMTHGDDSQYVFFDPAMRSRWAAVVDAFPGERVRLVSHSRDLMQFVVLIEGPQHGYSYQLINMNTARLMPLGDVYEGLKQTFEVRPISYAAADGLKIPAYLTLPAGRAPKNLPLIVMPHGGPAARDYKDFDWWAQALASQGYAVLKPNFRGSTVSEEMEAAGFGEWGRKMQTDLSDGVRYLAREGIIDPARVCIVGASYVGYAALAGVTLDPGVYRCAVSVAGISDLRRMLKWVNDRDAWGEHSARRFWNRFMGITGYDDPVLDQISPIKHIDKVDVPVMLIHGRDDTVVAYEQSEVMQKALRDANKRVEFITLKKEDHWLSRSETRLQMLQTSVAFLKANNPPD